MERKERGDDAEIHKPGPSTVGSRYPGATSPKRGKGSRSQHLLGVCSYRVADAGSVGHKRFACSPPGSSEQLFSSWARARQPLGFDRQPSTDEDQKKNETPETGDFNCSHSSPDE